jgi:aldehyde:ferredoxin oxidoreductase
VGGKSPLTGGIKEANAGTQFSQKMARLGIHALVVEGQPKEKGKFWLLKLDKDGTELHPADEWTGKSLYEVYPQVLKKYGKTVGLEAIGVAGEMLMANAGVCFNDIDNRPSRYAGRGGLGAVLGSKGLKFIVVDDKGSPAVKIDDKNLFKKGTKKLIDALGAHDITKPGGGLNTYGTAVLINVMNEAGGLPTRNFSDGRFEGADATSGEAIKDTTDERGGAGMTGHPCHPGCIIKCSNVWARPDGSEHVSCIEYESDWAFGANCGIDDLDAIAELIWLCNDYGHRADERDRQRHSLGEGLGERGCDHGERLRRRPCPGGKRPEHACILPTGREGDRCNLRHHPHGGRPHGGIYYRTRDPRGRG